MRAWTIPILLVVAAVGQAVAVVNAFWWQNTGADQYGQARADAMTLFLAALGLALSAAPLLCRYAPWRPLTFAYPWYLVTGLGFGVWLVSVLRLGKLAEFGVILIGLLGAVFEVALLVAGLFHLAKRGWSVWVGVLTFHAIAWGLAALRLLLVPWWRIPLG